jgi:uncharacterized protein (TIGR02246 family)
MKAAKLPLTTILMAFSLALAGVASDSGASAKQPASEQKNQSSPGGQTTDADAQKYEEAYNKGDAKTLVGFYSDDVDYIDQDGAEVKGRDAIERLLADNFQQNPGAKLAITTEEVKQLTPDVKVTRGFATVTPANGAAETTRYTAVRVRKGDHWEISQLNERRRLQALIRNSRFLSGWLEPGRTRAEIKPSNPKSIGRETKIFLYAQSM